MIRLTGLVELRPIHNKPIGSKLDEKLDAVGHEDADVDNDGDTDAADKYLKKRRTAISKNLDENDGTDHEVSMANNSLDKIIQSATELKEKLGMSEKDIPAWIQDHITNAANYIEQAASNYHEYNQPDKPQEENPDGTQSTQPQQEPMNEKAPEGWEGTVKAMKKHKEVDNPWALAHYMKAKGYKSHKKS